MFRYACADLLGVLRLLMFCVVRVRCCFWVPLFACLSSFLNTGVAYDQAKRGLHHHVDAASRFVLRTNEGMNLRSLMRVLLKFSYAGRMSKSRVACVHNKMRAGCKVCLRERAIFLGYDLDGCVAGQGDGSTIVCAKRFVLCTRGIARLFLLLKLVLGARAFKHLP